MHGKNSSPFAGPQLMYVRTCIAFPIARIAHDHAHNHNGRVSFQAHAGTPPLPLPRLLYMYKREQAELTRL